VVDTYTMRVTCRHELIYSNCGYEELQDLFMSQLPEDIDLYQDYHAQLVEVGKRYCRPTPQCEECPLLPVLGKPTPDEWL
jgi:endonuclease-3 related protein